MRARSFAPRTPTASTALLIFALSSCFTYQQVRVESVDPRAAAFVVSPVRAHLADGSTIVFPRGFTLKGDTVIGPGSRYAPGLSSRVSANSIVLDSVVGMETFETEPLVGKTFLVSTAATVVTMAGSIALLKAIFGSCPTFYSDSSGVPVLEAEGFSYSIAPLFEHRDVDRLRAVPTEEGVLSLEVRNEALETHYINHLELLEVRRALDEYVTPDNKDRPLALRGLHPPAAAIDRAGRDVMERIASADGELFGTDSTTLANARAGDLDDYIDLEIPNPGRADTVALVLRMRNSLLNTVLLYDQILGEPGARSLDWLARDIQRIAPAVEMGKWYSEHMGMRIAVRDGGTYTTIGRIGDSGPIAFHEVGFLVPVPRANAGDNVHVRISFVADQWRIDQIQVATTYRRPSFRSVPASAIVTQDPSQGESALRDLREADERYVVTSPGQSFIVRFDVGKGDGSPRTWLLASQGYYTEWVRGSWIKSASGQQFRATDQSLVAALNRWRSERSTLEQEFYSTRIATR
jgi:predicted RNA-binding protein with TRAM domain